MKKLVASVIGLAVFVVTHAVGDITYPVDVNNTQWAVVDTTTGEIINRRGQWPVANGDPIPGLDPRYVYLLHVDQTPVDYDSRLYYLEGVETVDIPANELRLTWNAVKRAVDEQETAAKNAELLELAKHIDLTREAIVTRLTVGAIIRHIKGQQLPVKAQAMVDEYEATAVKLWLNRDRLDEILQNISDGLEPDLDAGWEPAE